MNNVKAIREKLGLTQAALAEAIGCTQGNVWHYEQGQAIPPRMAEKLIAHAKSMGHEITFNDVYGAPISTEGAPAIPAEKAVA